MYVGKTSNKGGLFERAYQENLEVVAHQKGQCKCNRSYMYRFSAKIGCEKWVQFPIAMCKETDLNSVELKYIKTVASRLNSQFYTHPKIGSQAPRVGCKSGKHCPNIRQRKVLRGEVIKAPYTDKVIRLEKLTNFRVMQFPEFCSASLCTLMQSIHMKWGTEAP